jgi:hypothetical protein
MTSTDTTTSEEIAELCVGELYRDADGHEVWRIKEAETGRVIQEGIAFSTDTPSARPTDPQAGLELSEGSS